MTTEPRQEGDETSARQLLMISGIGPSVAKRLAATGLDTLEALAGASADDVYDRTARWPSRPGKSRVRDWIGQARRALEAGPSPDADPPRVRHTFTLEVQTDDTGGNTAVATRIVDVESQAFDTWPGWDPGRLAQFVAEHSGLDHSGAEDGADNAEVAPASPAAQGVRGYGVVGSRVVIAGGTTVRTVLHVGAADTGADPEGRALEWELACGPAEGRAEEQLARERIDLVPGQPIAGPVDVAVPGHIPQARLVAVVRIVGPGEQPRLVHLLSDTTLEVVARR